jgi:hypothetical protein
MAVEESDMRWIRGAIAATIAATVGWTAARPADAGSGSAPTGTIYYQDLSTLDAATNTVVLYSMDGDGGNRTAVLRADRYVRPSRGLHGSTDPARWFLTMKEIEGAEVGGNPRRDVYAVRADGEEVRLTSDPATEYWMPDWVPGENQQFAVVSMLGRRWTSTDPDATVVPGTAGMYLLYVAFEGRDVTFVRGTDWPGGLSSTTSTTDPRLFMLLFSEPWIDGEYGPSPDVASYAWSSYLLFLTVQDLDVLRPRIRFLYAARGQEGDLFSHDLVGHDLDWERAQNEGNIAYARFVSGEDPGTDTWAIETMGKYGQFGAMVTEVSVPHPATASTTRSLSRPKFSPDYNDYGQPRHVVYQVQRNGTGTTYTIHRDEVGGNGSVNLTPDVRNAAAGETGMVLVAWR